MQNSSSSILLFDSEIVRDSGRAEDLFGMKLVTYLSSLQTYAGDRRRRRRMPLAIVFTKTDQCDEAVADPKRFRRQPHARNGANMQEEVLQPPVLCRFSGRKQCDADRRLRFPCFGATSY